MPAAARRGRAALGALALLLTGCATVPPPPPRAAPSLAEARQAVARWAAARAAFTGFRAGVDLTVRQPGQEDYRTAAVLLLSPESLRLEVATPFGLPALVTTLTPTRLVVFRPLERSAWSGQPTSAAVTRWLGTPVPPATLVGLLAGQVPLPRDPTALRVEPDPEPHLAFDQDGLRHRVWVGADGRPARLRLEGREPLVATLAWGDGEPSNGAPVRLELEAPAREARVTVGYHRVEAVTPPPEAFELTLPSGVRVERVD